MMNIHHIEFLQETKLENPGKEARPQARPSGLRK